ncbi:MAG: LysR family transcriptional regulator [Alphaproteobacteria bacterium]|nr:LysR family transcriptional regulator [Alphaproteobacteria bacterium]
MQSIYVFVKLAENNCDFNIHKVLGIPRSSMWTYVSDLEKSLGRKLINRKKQGVSFTAAGKEFIPYAYRIYQTYEESLVSANKVEDSSIEGDILVSTTNAVALQWSMDSIKILFAEHPNLRLHISASDIISREEENVYDVLVRPFNDSENYKKIWYTVYHHGLFASQEYIDIMGMPTSPEELTSHRMIGYGEHTYSYFEDINWHLRGQGYGLPKLKPVLTINSTKAIFEATKTGLGICSAAIESNSYYSSNLIRILPEINGPTIKTFFCIKKNATGRKLKCISTFNTYYIDYLKTLGVNIIPLEKIE